MVRNQKCMICKNNNLRFFFEEKDFHYLKCNKCGFIFAKEYSEVDPSLYKEKIPKRTTIKNIHKAREQVAKNDVKNLKKYKKNCSLLEIGCSQGTFLLEAKKSGFDVQGIEPCPYFTNYNKKNGLNVFGGYLNEFNTKKKYEVVVLWDVFEHIPQFYEEIKLISKFVKVGGLLVLRVPNSNYAYYKSKLFSFFGIKSICLDPPRHLFFFSKKSLFKLVKKEGFKVVKFSVNRPRIPVNFFKRNLSNFVFYATLILYKLSFGKINLVVDNEIYVVKL